MAFQEQANCDKDTGEMESFNVLHIKEEQESQDVSTYQVAITAHSEDGQVGSEVDSSQQTGRDLVVKEEPCELLCEGEEADTQPKSPFSSPEDHRNSGRVNEERPASGHLTVLDKILGSRGEDCSDVVTSSEVLKEETPFSSKVTHFYERQLLEDNYAANRSQTGFQWESSEEDTEVPDKYDYVCTAVYEDKCSVSGQAGEVTNGWSLDSANPPFHDPDSGDTVEKPHSCQFCGKRFRSIQGVSSHMQRHKPYHCPKCNKGYYSKDELDEHMEIHNRQVEMLFECTYLGCNKAFANQQGLSRHMQTHPQERPYRCPQCNSSFGTSNNLKQHMKLHTKEPKFRCAECGEGFHREGHFARHVAKHAGKKLFKCQVCPREYNFKGALDVHTKKHIKDGDLIYKCCQCGKTHPPEHLSELKGNKPYQCIVCNSGFLEEEVKNVSVKTKSRGLRCPYCFERFWKVSELAKHVVDVHPEKDYHQCPECTRAFPLKSQLAVHLKVHRKVKQDCPVCGVVLVSKRALRDHLSKHTGERKYECSMCDKSYRYLSSLKEHVISHSGVKQFKCSLCAKAFAHKDTMRRHEKTHATPKPQEVIIKPWGLKIRGVDQKESNGLVEVPQEGQEVCVSTDSNHSDSENALCSGKSLLNCSNDASSVPNERKELTNGTLCYDKKPLQVQCSEINSTGQTCDKPYPCPKCGKGFATQQAVNSHMQFHKPFHCSKCSKGFYSNVELDEHMETHKMNHQEMMYQCQYPDCGKEFPTRGALTSHMQRHPSERPFSCPQCEKAFGSKNNLRVHMKRHNREPNFRCTECGEGFLREVHFARHMAKHAGQKLYTCTICQRGYNFKRRFDSHMKTHKGELIYKCSKCEKTFPHEGEQPYKCEECNNGFLEVEKFTYHEKKRSVRCHHCHEKFPKVVDLLKHMDTSHPGQDSHKCPECGKTFPLKSKLSVHIHHVHRKEKQECPLCGMVLISKRSLKSHLRKHRGERNYECTTCGKKFFSLSSLKRHTRIHTGIKPYKCNMCEKSFTHYNSLKSHHRTHTGEKSHLCSLCGKGFREKRDLESHIRWHAGEVPFECVDCNKSYTSRSSLRLHMRTHRGGKQFPCPKCDGSFYTKTVLRAHLKTHSQDEN